MSIDGRLAELVRTLYKVSGWKYLIINGFTGGGGGFLSGFVRTRACGEFQAATAKFQNAKARRRRRAAFMRRIHFFDFRVAGRVGQKPSYPYFSRQIVGSHC